jgi:hypothetical protein
MDLESKRPSGPLFRVGRDREAWAIPDWAYAKEDRTFGNRFDAPMGAYRVLYASSQRLGYFIETLARFRVDVSFVADLALMAPGESDSLAQRGDRGSVSCSGCKRQDVISRNSCSASGTVDRSDKVSPGW